MIYILHFIRRISTITRIRVFLELEETLTEISRELLKKLEHRAEQNSPIPWFSKTN